MAPQFVKAYRKNDKNDGNDAEAICEAVQRPSMRFVPLKSPEQQAELAVHRIRQRLMGERTALINPLRGLLAESGWCSPRVPTRCAASCPRCLRTALNPCLR
jgi:transposase